MRFISYIGVIFGIISLIFMKNRALYSYIEKKHQSRTGRIIVLTGARQTGKTTLVKKLFSDYEYLSIEDPVMRVEYNKLTAAQWKNNYPRAILDEVQKEPRLIGSIKAVYDQWDEPKYILLGSSQLLLLEKVKESLAGRCIIMELFPLTLPELTTQSWEDPLRNSLFLDFIRTGFQHDFLPSFFMDKRMPEKKAALDHATKFGGYPAVSEDILSAEEKNDWLKNYVKTYLERDIRDLASFRDLDPFVKLQRYLALNTGNLVNASAIAGHLGISSKSVQRYIQYFELSYQAISLMAWSRNKSKRLVKSPKIHYLDSGVINAVLQKSGGMTGNEYESFVISEIFKQIKNADIPVSFYHLRTFDGREVDLLLEFPEGYIAFEIKMSENINKRDSKNLKNLKDLLDKPLIQSFILSNDPKTKYFDDKIVALHTGYFLS